MAEGKIRVNADALNDLAARVGQLQKVLSSGPASGCITDLQKVGDQNVSQALGNMSGDGSGTSAFARTYSMEHKALVETYNSMISQLTELQKRCTETAARHSTNEQDNKNLVTKSGGEI